MTPERLVEFIDGLETATPGQKIAARNLLIALAGRGELPKDGGEMASWLGPIFSTTPVELREFRKRCEILAPPVAKEPGPEPDDPESEKQLRWRGRIFFAAMAALWCVPLAFTLRPLLAKVELPAMPKAPPFVDPDQRPLTSGRVLSDIGEAVNNANVYFAGRHFKTDEKGNFTIRQDRSLPAAFPVLATHPSFDPVLETVQKNGNLLVRFRNRAPGGPPYKVPVPKCEDRPMVPNDWRRWLVLYPWVFRIGLPLLAMAPILFWMLWGYLKRAQLRQKASRFQSHEMGIAVGNPAGLLFRETQFQRSVEQLRQRQKQDDLQLDFEATVLATAAQGGIFRAAYRARLAAPEYLALIERHTLEDAQARWCDTLLDRLESGGVKIDRYYIYPGRSTAQPASAAEDPPQLVELLRSQRWTRLLFFSDGRAHLDRLSQLPRWLRDEPMDEWPVKLLLTPVSPADWGDVEESFRSAGYPPMPATPDGMAWVAELLSGRTRAVEELGPKRPYPPLLRREPERWVERHPPAADRQKRLLTQLEKYLGQDGFEWLAGCTIYPALSWPLTVWLGRSIGVEKREDILLRMAALPWFRLGFLPNWLRDTLRAGMTPEAAARLRRDLDAFLTERSYRGAARDALKIAGEERRRRPGERDVLMDRVFVQFLAGVRPDRLAMAAPKGWRGWLFEEGLARLGLKRGAAAGALTLMALLGFGASAGLLGRYGSAPVERVCNGYTYVEYQEPREELDPVSMRALEVAQSQVGKAGRNNFLGWCFEQAAAVVGLPNPMAGKTVKMLRPLTVEEVRAKQITGRGLLTVDEAFVERVDLEKSAQEVQAIDGSQALAVSRELRHYPSQAKFFLASENDVRVNPRDGLKYVYVPAGKFMMGCSPGDKQCLPQESPAHEVELTKGFWMGQTEVTQAAYEKVTRKSNPSSFKGADRPVEQVSWNDATGYCEAVRMRLPTEAEWEYAAGAGSTGAAYGEFGQVAWYFSNSGKQTHTVATKKPNAWGLYDMLGNVWEWTADWHDPKYYEQKVSKDPQGPAKGTEKVVRGGSWDNDSQLVRASYRLRYVPSVRDNFLGFRCAGDALDSNPTAPPPAPVSLPKDFQSGAIRVEAYLDTRVSPTGSIIQEMPFFGNTTARDGLAENLIISAGPTYAPKSGYPYARLDNSRNIVIAHPCAADCATPEGTVFAFCPTTPYSYRVQGAFARANTAVSNGVGVQGIVFKNTDLAKPLELVTLSSDLQVDPKDLLGGRAVQRYDVTTKLTAGDCLRIGVFAMPYQKNGTFDATAVQFTITPVSR